MNELDAPPPLDDERASLLQQKSSLKRSQHIGDVAVPRFNFYICFFTNFVSTLGFSIIIPSLWPYLESTGGNNTFLGIVVASFSAGQLVGAPILGFLGDRHFRVRTVLLLSMCIDVCGQLVYATSATHTYGDYSIVLARVLSGFAAGNQAVLQGYISACTSMETRSKHLGRLMTALSAAYILGPAAGAVLAFVDFKVGALSVDAMTAPAWFNLLLLLVASILLLLVFRDHPIPKHQHAKETSLKVPNEEAHAQNKYQQHIQEDESPDSTAHNSLAMPAADIPDLGKQERKLPLQAAGRLSVIGLLCVCNLLVFNCLVVYETISTPLTMANYGWAEKENGGMWAVIGCVSAVAFTLLGILSRGGKNDIPLMYSTGLALTTAFALLVDWHFHSERLELWRFLLGTALVAFTFPVCQTEIMATFSKVVGFGAQGSYFGAFTAAGSVARIVGPIWSATAYKYVGSGIVFFICMCGLGVMMLLLLCVYPSVIRIIQQNKNLMAGS